MNAGIFFYRSWTKNVPRASEVIATKEDVLVSLVPELFAEAERRYAVLKEVSLQAPIGRRAIADATGFTERVVRNLAAELESNGLVTVTPAGISMTRRGEQLLVDLAAYFRTRQSVKRLERELVEILAMKEVRIVRGDSSRDRTVQRNLAQEGALLVARYLADDLVVAVSGGTTLSLVAKALPESTAKVTVVPARGGFGETLETQANTIAAMVARKTRGTYRMLHVPDGFSPELIDILRREDKSLREVEALIHRADLLIMGIGDAARMADLRQIPPAERATLMTGGAVGETLGYYARADGEIVYCRHNVGLTLEELGSVPDVVLVAGGSQKAAAILAMARAGVHGRLVTDEGAAQAIYQIVNSQRRQTHVNKSRD